MLSKARALMSKEAFIGGQWIKPYSRRVLPVVNPARPSEVFESAACGGTDVSMAVQAAREAFVAWSGSSFERRREILRSAADGIEEQKESLAMLESLNTGKPVREAEGDMDECIAAFRHSADLTVPLEAASEQSMGDLGDGLVGVLRKEPAGVVAGICPWNYPAMMAAWKIAPALAAGCTVVIKPSELTPFTTLALAGVLKDSGLPAGCLSVLPGNKATGAALAAHPDVDKVSFTGSEAAGISVMREASSNVVPVTLELGGKSPAVLMEDADLDQALEWLLFGAFWNCGQICSATSRILVHASREKELKERLVEAARALSVGPPLEGDDHDMGPLISAAQLDRVEGFLRQAKAEGNKVLTGGKRLEGAEGYFFEPTILDGVNPGDTVWSEEIFGPVVSVTPFSSDGEAVTLANDSRFGLAGAVFGEDAIARRALARRLRVGTVWENCNQPVPPRMPWGGYRRSGIGREMGPNGLDAFLEQKSITQATSQGATLGWFSGFRS